MQFPFDDCIVNLLDTPGHEDFSEDTYRTLTAVDSALMVIDCAKGVEERTIRLMEVCRLRATPIMTFINKLDRDGRAPLDLLDEIERVLGSGRAPVTWPIGMGRDLMGTYHLTEDRIYVYEAGERGRVGDNRVIEGLASDAAREFLGDRAAAFDEEVELVRGAATPLRPGGLSRRQADAGVLRLGDQQLRRRGTAARLRRACAAPAAARQARQRDVDAARAEAHAASCSRSRPTWIPAIATASPSCACARDATLRGMRLYPRAAATRKCGWPTR